MDLYQESQKCQTGESSLNVQGGRGGQEEAEMHILCPLYPLSLSNIKHGYHLKLVISVLFVHSEQVVYL